MLEAAALAVGNASLLTKDVEGTHGLKFKRDGKVEQTRVQACEKHEKKRLLRQDGDGYCSRLMRHERRATLRIARRMLTERTATGRCNC